MGSVYRCDVKHNLNISSYDDIKVDSTSGVHPSNLGYSNSYVKAIDIRNKLVNYFPKGFEKIFTAIQLILVNDCQLKHVNQTDLKPFTGLKVLDLEGNDLGILEEGIFDLNINLQWVSLSRNRILHVDLDVFDKLASLAFLSFGRNKCLSKDPAYDSTTVKELIVKIKASCNSADYLSLNSTLKGLQRDLRILKLDNFKTFSDQLYGLEKDFEASKFSYFTSFDERLEGIKYDKKFTRLENFYLIETKIKEIETDEIYYRTQKIVSKFENVHETAGSELEQEIDNFDGKLEGFNDKFSSWTTNLEYKAKMTNSSTTKPSKNREWDKKFKVFERRLTKSIDRSFRNLERRLIKLINDI